LISILSIINCLFVEIDEHVSDRQQQTTVETKSRLPYTKRTRIQYTVQQVTFEEMEFN